MNRNTLRKARAESAKKPGLYIVVAPICKRVYNVIHCRTKDTAIYHYKSAIKRGQQPIMVRDGKVCVAA
jgi:hypothetical protein